MENAAVPVSASASASAPAAPARRFFSRFALSPLNRRRLANFRANRRGFYSFVILVSLFVISLFAEFIANDRPILASYKGELLVPVLVDYPESKFGGFLADTIWLDPEIYNEIEAHGWILWPPVRFGARTTYKNTPVPFPAPPTWLLKDEQCAEQAAKVGGSTCADIDWNWLGTDMNGYDIVARVLYGFRLSLVFALILAFCSSVVGVVAGAVQGYFGGKVDLIFQRVIEIWTSVPQLYLIIILSAFFAPGFFTILTILLFFSWISLVGLVRAEFLRARNFEYVRAARALGLSNLRIMFRHILPNAMVATLTYLPFIIGGGITTLTSLDYLGFGMPPGTPSLGDLVKQGGEHPDIAPWIVLTVFTVLSVMMSLLVFIGEAVRDAFDPRKSFE
jgi:microcin C transport system permease protein